MRWLHGKRTQQKRLSGRTRLLLGAGGLLLFIVGLKRSHTLDDQSGTVLADEVLRRPVPPPPP